MTDNDNIYDMDLGIPGEEPQDEKQSTTKDLNPANEKPNIFVRCWRGIKKAHDWVNAKISDHPNLAKIAIGSAGAAAGIGVKIGYDYFKSRHEGAIDEYESEEETYLPEPESEIEESGYEPTEETEQTEE